METYNDSDDKGLAIVMDGDEDQDIQSDTEHAGVVDTERNEEVADSQAASEKKLTKKLNWDFF